MLSVQMPESDWIRLINLIANYPFKQVAPLINTIQQQLSQQLQRQEQMTKPNGADQPEARM
jgi:hypothetical protein